MEVHRAAVGFNYQSAGVGSDHEFKLQPILFSVGEASVVKGAKPAFARFCGDQEAADHIRRHVIVTGLLSDCALRPSA